MDDKKLIKTAIYLIIFVVFMVCLTFASAPLYKMFCQITGFDGTPIRSTTQNYTALQSIKSNRIITVEFNADTDKSLLWDFKPEQRKINANIGKPFLIYYTATNKSPHPSDGTATFNVTPLKAGQYFHKIQCFCFKEQLLSGGQSKKLPVSFYIDPAILKDSFMDDVHNITLSYTFFSKKNP
jgi:cytochrome c oxidase assembly protein subunit 11